jgi:hypothetical protein
LDNWNKIEFIFCFKLRISPIDLEKLEFYHIQYILKQYEEHIDRENKEYEKQQKETDKKYQSSNLKLPNNPYGDFKIPKYEMPKFNIPKS